MKYTSRSNVHLCYLLCLIIGIRQRQKQIHRDSWVQYLKARVVHTSMDREYGFRAHIFCHCVFCSDSDVNYSDYKNNLIYSDFAVLGQLLRPKSVRSIRSWLVFLYFGTRCTGAHFHLDCNRTNVLDNTNSIGHLSWKPNNIRTFLSCSLEQRVLNGKFSAMTENNTQSNSSTVHTGLKSN